MNNHNKDLSSDSDTSEMQIKTNTTTVPSQQEESNSDVDGQLSETAQTRENSEEETQEWRETVTQDLRDHLVRKVVQSVLTTCNHEFTMDERVTNLLNYARKTEHDAYLVATSRAAYYHMLAEKIYNIQKVLEGKLKRKKEMQNQSKSQEEQ